MTRRFYMNESPEWAWLDKIEVGDILLSGRGVERVVRRATYYKKGDRYGRDGKLRAVTFVIQRCSWTERCYTVVNRSDLKILKFTPTGKKKRSIELIDKLIAHDLIYTHSKRLDCCDVKGLR